MWCRLARVSSSLASGPFAALGQRNFRIYWLGQAISLIGVWMQQMALSWVVAGLTESKTRISMAQFLWFLPTIALTMYGGAVADRFDRRKLLIITQIALMLVAFAYVGLLALGALTLLHVYVLGMVLGAIMAFDLPAQHSLVPRLVPDRLIPQAIALNQALFHGARLLGPAVAGLVIGIASTSTIFVLNGISYLAVVGSLLIITTRPREGARSALDWKSLGEGVLYVRAHSDLKAMLAVNAFTSSLVMPFLIFFMAIAVRTIFRGDSSSFGIVMSATGLGAMLGSLAVTLVPAAARGKVIVSVCTVAGVVLGVVAWQDRVWVVAPLCVVLSFSVALAMGLATTVIQIKVPDQFRGRVMSLHTLTFIALMPSAALLLGIVQDHVGMRPALAGMSAIYLLCAVPYLLFARVWRLPVSQPG